MPMTRLTFPTCGQGLYEFTDRAAAFLRETGAEEGLLTAFVRHTSCSLLIQENADPDVRRDLDSFFARLVPPADDQTMRWIVHTSEGPDDMPAHIKAALTQTSLGIPVAAGRMLLGTWQGLYLFDTAMRRIGGRWCCSIWGRGRGGWGRRTAPAGICLVAVVRTKDPTTGCRRLQS